MKQDILNRDLFESLSEEVIPIPKWIIDYSKISNQFFLLYENQQDDFVKVNKVNLNQVIDNNKEIPVDDLFI